MEAMRIAAALALLAALAGCKDGPTDTQTKSLALEIRMGEVPVEEETIAPDGTLSLTAAVREPSGKEASGSAAVQWRVENDAVVGLSVTSGPAVTVQARQVGTTRIIATSGKYADTARVNVANRVSGYADCAPGSPGVSLGQVGQVRTLEGEQALNLCVEAGVTGAEYALIAFNASEVAGARLGLEVLSAGVVPVVGPPNPALAPPLPGVRPVEPNFDEDLHLRMLERSRVANRARLRSASGLPLPSRAAAAAPTVGQILRLNVQANSAVSPDGCTKPDYRFGRVVAISERAIVVADTANPKRGFSDADYASLAAAFDTLVWPVDTRNFGTPEDVDKNGKVLIFYTRAVNELTASNSDSYVGGFFFNRDLFPTTGQNACAGSNYAEMFYMLVPDPFGEINGNVRTTDFVRERTVGVLAHEFQHLINDSRRLYVNKAAEWEETWLNEGLSHIAEELMFYQASGLGPRQNVGPQHLATQRTTRAFNEYAADNVSRFIRYLQLPENASLMGRDELPTRGATWSFLRYAADRESGSDEALWKALTNSTTSGLANLGGVLGVNPRDWMRDWTVSVYGDDALPGLEARFTQPSWNMRALLPSFSSTNGRYPLRTSTLPATGSRSFVLQGGGAAYLRFGVAPGQRGAIRAVVGNLPAPSRLKVSLVRTR